MKPGSTYNYLRDEEDPLRSPNTQSIAALLSCGGELVKEGGFLNAVGTQDGKPTRTVVWVADEREIRFEDFKGDVISTSEFLRRWNDRTWLAANLDHPITYIRTFMEKIGKLRDAIRENPPQLHIQKSGRSAYISTTRGPDGKLVPTERGRKLLEIF
jgi:hypothetical protein